LGSDANVDVLHVPDDAVPRPSGSADRVLAVNLLHEVRGEGALAEMRRLLADDGFALIVDWERGRPREAGPPDDLLYDAAEARAVLAAAGLDAVFAVPGLPYHFAFIATPIT
jgi:SAM-dependent methyltransferase